MAATSTPVAVGTKQSPDIATLARRYEAVRALSEALAAPLTPEDQQVQTMADVSPTKWHLAHITWFFETFLLQPHLTGYVPFHPRYGYLFNSYYEAVGPRHARARRGDLSRPTVAEILGYRAHVDRAMARLFDRLAATAAAMAAGAALAPLIELGLHHEQQHQELILMDIKHVLGANPLAPAYAATPAAATPGALPAPLTFQTFAGGLREIGADQIAATDFAFDNEMPRHTLHVAHFALARRPVSNGEYLAFIADGGYREPSHWLSDGWAWVQSEGITAPLYWRRETGTDTDADTGADDAWREFTLMGERPLDLAAPVCHVSYYEADAYARWAGYRLPTEAEWETAACAGPVDAGSSEPRADANLLDSGRLHPVAAPSGHDAAGPAAGLRQMFGDVWEWTASAYGPYPGYRPSAGAVGEYNGKFMINQMVLRGGSALTPPGHVRVTYRNFFYPHQRWPMTGIRLASDG